MCTLQQHRFHWESFFFGTQTERKSHVKARGFCVLAWHGEAQEPRATQTPVSRQSKPRSFLKPVLSAPPTTFSPSVHSPSGTPSLHLYSQGGPCHKCAGHSASVVSLCPQLHSQLRSTDQAGCQPRGVGGGEGPSQDREDTHKLSGFRVASEESPLVQQTKVQSVYKWLASKLSSLP